MSRKTFNKRNDKLDRLNIARTYRDKPIEDNKDRVVMISLSNYLKHIARPVAD